MRWIIFVGPCATTSTVFLVLPLWALPASRHQRQRIDWVCWYGPSKLIRGNWEPIYMQFSLCPCGQATCFCCLSAHIFVKNNQSLIVSWAELSYIWQPGPRRLAFMPVLWGHIKINRLTLAHQLHHPFRRETGIWIITHTIFVIIKNISLKIQTLKKVYTLSVQTKRFKRLKPSHKKEQVLSSLRVPAPFYV